jgi:hypothetical protein
MRRQDPDLTLSDIAGQLGGDATPEDVAAALATLRCRNPRPSRASLNATLTAASFVQAEAHPDEPTWQVLDRLLGELERLRRVISGLTPERSGLQSRPRANPERA